MNGSGEGNWRDLRYNASEPDEPRTPVKPLRGRAPPPPYHPFPGRSPHKEVPRNAWKIPVRLADIGNAVIASTPINDLFDQLAKFANDPLGFVMWAFPWGEPGTSLEGKTGPEPWQREQLTRIGDRLTRALPEVNRLRREDVAACPADLASGTVIEEDVSSGHGVGKSAEVAWLCLWAISTHEDTRGVVTANTEAQLRTKSWPELGKWYQLFIGRQLFTFTATSLHIAGDSVREKTWRIDQIAWSKERSEAFAGLHNEGKRVLVVFDEAAAIDDAIYDVTEGVLTDARTQILWMRYGNPTRTSGRFHANCTSSKVNKRNHYTRVDSRDVSFSNKGQIAAWIEDYGEDSDFVRVRVKGQFPRAGFANFISPELVAGARRRRIAANIYQPYQKVLAVDPARFGDDASVITLRQGLKVHWQVSLSGFDGPDLASRIVDLIRKEPAPKISCIAFDAIGNGADLDSALRRMSALPLLIPVMWGQPAKDDKQYFNQRSECWGRMRDWLEHGEIPDDDTLSDQLTSLDYGYDGKMRIQLQSKKDLKKNGGKSPDMADSLALSFVPDLIDRKVVTAKALPVRRRTIVWSR